MDSVLRCGGCKKFAPAFAKLVRAREFCDVVFGIVDVDEAADLAAAHDATALPLFLVFVAGRKVDSLVGGKQTLLWQKITNACGGTCRDSLKDMYSSRFKSE